MRTVFVAWLLLFVTNAHAVTTRTLSLEHTKLSISHGTKKDDYYIILKFKIEKDWKISFYHKSKLDLASSVKLENIAYFEVDWPEAEQLEEFGIVSDIYRDQLILPIKLKEPYNGETKLLLNYTICNKICIPQNHIIDLQISQSEVLTKEEAKVLKCCNLLLWSIFIAFIGGIVLNVMPCVLPVLSIKLLSIIKQTQLDTRQLRRNFFASFLGIVTSFVILAVVAMNFKMIGANFGLGLYFQEPIFLTSVLLLLIVFASNLCGDFEFNLPGVLNKVQYDKFGYFTSGIFATLLATPCSAPFVGTAMSFALSRGYSEIFMIFTAMGIGLGLPYLLLMAYPRLVYLLPKPGNWMLKLRYGLGVILFLTSFWIMFILAQQIGKQATTLLFLLCLLLRFALAHQDRMLRFSFIKALFILSIIASAFIMPASLVQQQKSHEKHVKQLWHQFDQNKLKQAIDDNKVVVLDFTADWCVTCQVNKFTTLNNDVVITQLSKEHVIAMRADLTNRNPVALEYMKLHNRYAIPLNIIYGPNAPQGIILSEILTPSKLLRAIEQASGKN